MEFQTVLAEHGWNIRSADLDAMFTQIAGGPQGTADSLVGRWQETESAQACMLAITRSAKRNSSGCVMYRVEYPRSLKVPFPAGLKDGKLEIWGEGGSAAPPIWVVTYDEANDRLTAVGNGRRGTFTFTRMADQ